MKYIVYGDLADREFISAKDALFLVWIGRHMRLSRVHRHGRKGERTWVLNPRNVQEQKKRRSLLRH